MAENIPMDVDATATNLVPAAADAVEDLLGHAALDAPAAAPLVVVGRARELVLVLERRDAREVVRAVAQFADHIVLVVALLADLARRVPAAMREARVMKQVISGFIARAM